MLSFVKNYIKWCYDNWPKVNWLNDNKPKLSRDVSLLKECVWDLESGICCSFYVNCCLVETFSNDAMAFDQKSIDPITKGTLLAGGYFYISSLVFVVHFWPAVIWKKGISNHAVTIDQKSISRITKVILLVHGHWNLFFWCFIFEQKD